MPYLDRAGEILVPEDAAVIGFITPDTLGFDHCSSKHNRHPQDGLGTLRRTGAVQ